MANDSGQVAEHDVSTELSRRRTGMSYQRTRMSADRTLMSIIRTSIFEKAQYLDLEKLAAAALAVD